ncbi:hypothetical protein ZYGR_0I07460 [Zygosaccharomyces rouxii]|uniref:ZYRO0C17644p n=2 Tax=Zygosaccharomyces rouxii TaxID=4956 RepID=C5DUL0_ZYGRC|nr:uncharacterized protein ZYRO0C17644g [Zygosaccharomyces rouxii]KAH9201358.1 hypothetical protein LQ764DRAFT_218776 [Zygosaccharomyces rouxii]GAV48449.1 hypothetical protein ZYGR_0I07460 [Zygosaccharomyces rouxii]CAR27471.1 ZYRO0C17644p [Zygosaccharomyces rouxii]
MDFLPHLDQPAGLDYDYEVEKLMQDHLRDENDLLHPEVQKLLSKVSIPPRLESFYEFYSRYDDDQGWKRKRNETEDVTLDECRKRHKGIDLGKYDVNTDDLESLEVIDSYLKHQCLVLQNMNETMLNQWAINNDYVERASENLQDRISHERKQLESLDKYRESIQHKHGPQLKSIKDSWRQQLIRNVE